MRKPNSRKSQSRPRKVRAPAPTQHLENPPAANDNSPQAESQWPEPANDNSPQLQSPRPLESLIPNEIAAEAHSFSTSDAGAHLEGLEAQATSEAETGEGGAQAVEVASEVVSRETFRASIIGAFNFGGVFLKSFAITDSEKPSAIAAADALYDTALEVHWLRWLLDPQATTVQRVIVILSFVGPKARAILAEVKAARAPKKREPEPETIAAQAAHSGPRDPEPAR